MLSNSIVEKKQLEIFSKKLEERFALIKEREKISKK